MIHQDQGVATHSIFSNIIFNNIDSFLSIFSFVTNRVWIDNSCDCLHYNFGSINVESFVVNDQNSFFVVVEVDFFLVVYELFIIFWVNVTILCSKPWICQWTRWLIVLESSFWRAFINVLYILNLQVLVTLFLGRPFENQVLIISNTLFR